MNTNDVKVWDPLVRLFHWSLVTSVTSAYFLIDPRWLHKRIGYVIIALLVIRVVWGFIGTKHARFINFVPSPSALFAYLRSMINGNEARYLGHNPAGASMIIALLFTLTAITTTGYMMTMKAYFGNSTLEHLHEFFVNILLLLVVGHLGGVIFSSLKHKENLVKSMLTGKKKSDE